MQMYLLINGKPMVEDHKEFPSAEHRPTEQAKPIELTRIVKTKTDIKCYIGKSVYCTFGGVVNWDAFTVQGGEFEIEKPIPTAEELAKRLQNMQDAMDFLLVKEV